MTRKAAPCHIIHIRPERPSAAAYWGAIKVLAAEHPDSKQEHAERVEREQRKLRPVREVSS